MGLLALGVSATPSNGAGPILSGRRRDAVLISAFCFLLLISAFCFLISAFLQYP
jgi:hypothetical protein